MTTDRTALGPFAALAGVAALGMVGLLAGLGDVRQATEGFPWSILAIYVAMEMFSSLVSVTGASDLLAVRLARHSGAQRRGVLIAFAALLFAIGGFVNNLTDVVLILPVAMVLLRAMRLDQRFARSFFAMLLAVSNLAGAATPIGDFPAILILGSGLTSFSSYLTGAFPLFAATGIVLVVVYCVLNRSQPAQQPSGEAFSMMVLEASYRHRKLNRPALVRLGVVFAMMFAAWVVIPASVVPPEVIAWAGVAVAALALRRFVDRTQVRAFDLRPVLTIAAFLFGASLLTTTGVTLWAAEQLEDRFQDPRVLVVVLMLTTSLLCGVVSAGPAAAAMLPVLEALAGPGGVLSDQSDLLAVAFGAAICAGSSLFLFSATAGLMMASKVDDSRLVDSEGRSIRCGMRAYLPYGILNYGVQMSIAVAWVLVALK